jgi:hypothetical protein
MTLIQASHLCGKETKGVPAQYLGVPPIQREHHLSYGSISPKMTYLQSISPEITTSPFLVLLPHFLSICCEINKVLCNFIIKQIYVLCHKLWDIDFIVE